MAGIHFDITGDNSSFINSMKQVQVSVNATSKVLKDLSRDFDLSSLDDQVVALTKTIRQQEIAILKSKDTIAKYMDGAMEARNKNDMGLFNAFQKDIDEELKSLETLINETEQYKDALKEIEVLNGVSKGTEAPMLFVSKEDYDRVKALKKELEELRIQETNWSGNEKEWIKLQDSISKVSKKLREEKESAMEAASALGTKGMRMAEINTLSYELTDTIREQEEEVARLTAEQEKALERMKEAKSNRDFDTYEEERILWESYSEARLNALAKLKNSQQQLRDVEESGFRSLTVRCREAKDQLQALIDAGKEGTPELKRALEEVASIEKDISLQNLRISYERDGGGLLALKDGLQGIAGAASLATGAMGIFNTDTEEMEKIQTRIQSLLGIIVGLQESYGFAIKGTTIAQALFNKVASANPYVLLAIGVGTLITGLIAFSDEQDKATEKTKEFNDEFKNHTQEVAKGQVAIKNLQNEWSKLTDDKSKTDWIKENKDEFNSLGVEIETVEDAENLLIKNTSTVIEAMRLRAKAAAYAALATKKYQEALENREESSNISAGWWDYVMSPFEVGSDFDFKGTINRRVRNRKNEESRKNQSLERQGDEYSDMGQQLTEEAKKLLQSSGFRTPSRKTNEDTKPGRGVTTKQERENELIEELEYQEKLTKIRKDAEDARSEAEIEAIEDNGERERAKRKAQHDKTLRDLSDQMDDIYRDIYEQRKKEWEKTHKGGKYETDDEQGRLGWGYKAMAGTLNEKESEYFNARYAIIEAGYQKEEALQARHDMEMLRERTQSMRDYLKEYGTMEEKRLAIAQEYDEKIKKARAENNIGEEMRLEAEMKEKYASLQMDILKQDINWEELFGNLDRISTDALNDLKEKLRKTLDTKDITPENAKVLSEKILEIEDKISERTNIWSSLIPALKERERIVRNITQLEENAERASSNLVEAQTKTAAQISAVQYLYNQTTGKGISEDELRSNSNGIREELVAENDEKNKPLIDALNNLIRALGEETQAKQEETRSQQLLKNILKGFKGGVIGDIFKGAVEAGGGGALGVVNLIGQNAQSMAEFSDKIGLAGTDFGDAVHGFADGVGGFQKAIGALASGDVFGFATGIFEGIMGFGNMFGSIFGLSTSNVEESEKEIDRLVKSNADLGEALNDLRDELKDMNLSDTSTYIKAQEVANAQIQNGLRVVQTKMGEYDGHHSTNYYSDYATSILKSIAESAMRQGVIDYRKLSDAGAGINELLKYLTPEELDKLRTFDPEGWIRFMDAIRDADKSDLGAADTFLEYVNNYSDLMKELEDEWKETMLNLSWDSLKDSFRSALEDMEKDIDSWSDDLSDIFRKGVSNYLSTTYTNKDTGKLAQWYEKYFKAMESGGLDAAEVAQLRDEYLAIVKEATSERDRLYETLGIVESTKQEQQSATFNSAQNITYEQADTLVGINTAQLIALEQGNVTKDLILQNLAAMQMVFGGTFSEIRNLVMEGNNTRETMLKAMKEHFSNFTMKMDKVITTIQEQ